MISFDFMFKLSKCLVRALFVITYCVHCYDLLVAGGYLLNTMVPT